ncbi:MAG: HisA/HisF-related TIM barrel protein [Microthrixaceae bacterium]
MSVRGWRESSGVELLDAVARFEHFGVAAVIVTEIGRDGTLEGPDFEGLGEILEATSIPVIASGGVGTLAHLRELAAMENNFRRLQGAIVGRALYEGAFTADAAVEACRR